MRQNISPITWYGYWTKLDMKKYILLLFLTNLSFSYSQINPKDVEIVRDSFGVPHIYGKTDADVAYGLAWSQAEDDFKTIQQGYLAGNGLLSKQLIFHRLGQRRGCKKYEFPTIRNRILSKIPDANQFVFNIEFGSFALQRSLTTTEVQHTRATDWRIDVHRF